MLVDATCSSTIASTKQIYHVRVDIDWQDQSIVPLGNCAIGMTMSHFCIFLLVDINGILHQ